MKIEDIEVELQAIPDNTKALVFYVDVGYLPVRKAEELVRKVNEQLKGVVDFPYLVLPKGKERLNKVEAIPDNTKALVFTADCGMLAKERKESYLNSIREVAKSFSTSIGVECAVVEKSVEVKDLDNE